MKKPKHSERAQTQRTDVEWIDGVPYCQTCNRYVGADDVCGSDCAQGELARVLKHVRAKAKKEPAGSFTEEVLDDVVNELLVGAHR